MGEKLGAQVGWNTSAKMQQQKINKYIYMFIYMYYKVQVAYYMASTRHDKIHEQRL